MKILLDECVPVPMRKLLVGHECRSAQDATALAQVLAFLRNVLPAPGTPSSGAKASLFQEMNVQTNNSRLEISSSIPNDIAEKMFHNDGGTPTVIP